MSEAAEQIKNAAKICYRLGHEYGLRNDFQAVNACNSCAIAILNSWSEPEPEPSIRPQPKEEYAKGIPQGHEACENDGIF